MTLATRRQLVVLLLLTLVWGLNWPVMKVGVSGLPGAAQSYPPLTFRALSMWLGLPVLGAAVWWLKVPLALPRSHLRELALLTLCNMLVWHVVIIVALQQLSSGRSAILGYTMLVFGFAHAAWFYLARSMPPGANSVSVMLIPVLGVFSGALLLGEPLQWQDWAACALMVLAIAAVLFRR